MLSVALTGNVAAGKSTVLRLFAEWGATVIDADRLVREVQAPGSPVLRAIADAFGEDVLLENGELNRARLRGIIVRDPEARMALNAIVHPAVQRRRAERVAEAAARGDRVVVNDIPLLFEVLEPDAFDLVVLVDASEGTRLQRLRALRGLADDEARQLMAAQLPSAEKRDRSDFVIDNDGSRADLERAARAVWNTILARATRNSPQ